MDDVRTVMRCLWLNLPSLNWSMREDLPTSVSPVRWVGWVGGWVSLRANAGRRPPPQGERGRRVLSTGGAAAGATRPCVAWPRHVPMTMFLKTRLGMAVGGGGRSKHEAAAAEKRGGSDARRLCLGAPRQREQEKGGLWVVKVEEERGA